MSSEIACAKCGGTGFRKRIRQDGLGNWARLEEIEAADAGAQQTAVLQLQAVQERFAATFCPPCLGTGKVNSTAV